MLIHCWHLTVANGRSSAPYLGFLTYNKCSSPKNTETHIAYILCWDPFLRILTCCSPRQMHCDNTSQIARQSPRHPQSGQRVSGGGLPTGRISSNYLSHQCPFVLSASVYRSPAMITRNGWMVLVVIVSISIDSWIGQNCLARSVAYYVLLCIQVDPLHFAPQQGRERGGRGGGGVFGGDGEVRKRLQIP